MSGHTIWAAIAAVLFAATSAASQPALRDCGGPRDDACVAPDDDRRGVLRGDRRIDLAPEPQQTMRRGRIIENDRSRGAFIGRNIVDNRTTWITRPDTYGLGRLGPSLGYTRIGREIYIADRDTGAILALALVLSQIND